MQAKLAITLLIGALVGALVSRTAAHLSMKQDCERQLVEVSYMTNLVEAENNLKCLELMVNEKEEICIDLLENRLGSLLIIIDQLEKSTTIEGSESSTRLFRRAKEYRDVSRNPELFDYFPQGHNGASRKP